MLSISTTTPLAPPNKTDPVRSAEWFLDFLKIKDAHSISTGAGVTVGLPDTGTFPHRDFVKNLANGIDLTSGRSTSTNNDKDGHGTEMAGLIAGHGHGNSAGILGIAPDSRLLSIKVTEGVSQASELEAGIKAAATLGASVVNISAVTGPSRALEEAIHIAAQQDSVIIASSGNASRVATIGYPAALQGVLAVGAIGKNGTPTPSSIPGPNLGICAPGEKIITTGLKSEYSEIRGTSAATAITSGAAALVRARFPELSAQEVIHRLTATARDVGAPGWDEQCGYGVLDIVKALTADVPPLAGGSASAAVGAGGSSGAAAGGADHGGDRQKTVVLGGIAAVLAGGVLVAWLAVRRRGRKRL
ncbi:S8 family serine peptidase [Actinoplanes siamensis]|nr:S8 family serine peptidase [Actinoplanes siamensis]